MKAGGPDGDGHRSRPEATPQSGPFLRERVGSPARQPSGGSGGAGDPAVGRPEGGYPRVQHMHDPNAETTSQTTDPPADGKPRRPLGRTILILLVLALVVGVAGAYAYRKGPQELGVYTTASSRMVEGERIYRREDSKAFTYPPFAAVPYIPFLALPTNLHTALWLLLDLGILAYLIVGARSLLRSWLPGDGAKATRRWFWVILLPLAGRPLSAVFETKANDILILLLVFELARRAAAARYVVAGALAGIAAAFKATPWLFLPVFLWQRRFVPALVLVAIAALCHLLPDVAFPRNEGGSWTAAWYDTFVADVRVDQPAEAEGAWRKLNILNQSLDGTLYRLSSQEDPTGLEQGAVNLWSLEGRGQRIMILAAKAGVLLLVLLATRRRPRPEGSWAHPDLRAFGQVGSVLCGMLLLSPMSSKSHFCVLVIPLAYLVTELLRDRRRWIIGLHLALILVLGSLTSKGLIGKAPGEWILAHGSVTWCTVLTLSASTYALLRQTRTPAAGECAALPRA